MTDFARLGLAFESDGVEVANQRLDAVTDKAIKAEGAANRLESSSRKAGVGMKDMASAGSNLERTLISDAKALSDLKNSADMVTAAELRTAAAHAKIAASSKLTGTELLNLSRQFSDIGVTAAMGMNPLMILIQQGPQLTETFASAAKRGLGFSAVMREAAGALWLAVAPIAPFVAGAAAIAAVLGGGLLVAAHEANVEHKDFANTLGLTADQLEKVKNKSITMGDVLSGTFKHIGDSLKSEFAGPLKWLSETFEKIMKGIADGMTWAITHGVAVFSAGIAMIGKIFTTLPQIVGDATISAANAMIGGIQTAINAAIGAINKLIGGANEILGRAGLKFQLPGLDPLNIAKLQNPFAGAMKAVGEAGGKAFDKGLTSSSQWLMDNGKYVLDAAGKRIKAEAGKDKSSNSNGAQGPANDYAQRLEALDAQLAQAKASELQAQLSITKDVKARQALEHQILSAQGEAKMAQIKKQIADNEAAKDAGKITATEAATLKAKLMQLAWAEVAVGAAQGQAIDEKAMEALRKQEFSRRENAIQNQIDLLSSEAATKEFASQRLPIDRHILELQKQLARIKLEEILASTNSTDAEKAIAAAKLATLNLVNDNKMQAAVGGVLSNFKTLESSVGSFAAAFKAHDWASATQSLDKAITDIKVAFGPGGTFGSKLGAVAGIGQAVGSAVGGTAGSTISGLASGAMLGFQFGGPVGAAVGAVVGGIAGLFSGNSAEKKAKQQAAAAAAEKEAARLAQVAADKRSLELQIMELSGDAAGALAAKRADELKAMDASNRALAEQIYALQDAKDAQDKLNAKIAAFNEAWLTDAEKIAPVQAEVAAAFDKLGIAGLSTQEAFKTLVQSIDTSSKAGKELYAALLDVAPAFKNASDYAQQLTDTLTKSAEDALAAANDNLTAANDLVSRAQTALKAAYDKEASSITARINAAASAADAARTALRTAYDAEVAGIKQRVDDAKSLVEAARADLRTAYDAEITAMQARVDTATAAASASVDTLRKAYNAELDALQARVTLADQAVSSATAALRSAYDAQITAMQDRVSQATSALSSARDILKAAYDKELTALEDRVTRAVSLSDAARAALRSAYDSEVATLSEATTKAKAVTDAAREALKTAYNTEASALTETISKMRDFTKSIRDFRKQLEVGAIANLNPIQQYSASRAELVRIAQLAKAGDSDAMSKLQGTIESFLSASKVASTSSLQYERDLAFARLAIDQAATTADATASVAEQQLAELKSQVSGLIDISDGLQTVNGSVVSVKDAVAALRAAMADEATAKAVADSGKAQLDATVVGLLNVDASVKTVAQAAADLRAALLEEAAATAARDTGKAQLDATVSGLLAVDTSVKTVAEAVLMVQAAIAEQTAAQAAQTSGKALLDATVGGFLNLSTATTSVSDAMAALRAAIDEQSAAVANQALQKAALDAQAAGFLDLSTSMVGFADALAAVKAAIAEQTAAQVAQSTGKAQLDATIGGLLSVDASVKTVAQALADFQAATLAQSVTQAQADAQTAALNASVAGLIDVSDHVQSVQDAIDALNAAMADKALAESQLAALNAQVGGLLDVNNSVLSVGQAIFNLQGAVAQQAMAQMAVASAQQALLTQQAAAAAAAAAAQAASNQAVANALAALAAKAAAEASAPATPAAPSVDWASYLAHYPDVKAEYDRNMASSKGVAYLKTLGIGSATDFAAWHYRTYGQSEGRTPYAMGGIMTRPMTLGESGIGGEAGPEGIVPLVRTSKGLGVNTAGSNKELIDEIRALRAEMSRGADASEGTHKVIKNVTSGGSAMKTTVAS